jgi:serine protease Do
MKSKISQISVFLLSASVLLAACNTPVPLSLGQPSTSEVQSAATSVATAQSSQTQQSNGNGLATSLDAYQTALENIYAQVNPSVVSIRVVQRRDVSSLDAQDQLQIPGIPGFPNSNGSPEGQSNQPAEPQYSQALGSGFVWNKDGYLVTNNHVVNGADKIEVKFADGTTLSASMVGTDPDSDLAVIKVDNPGFELTPIQVDGSSDVKVGQVAIAIGNPFGLENTMTAGIVSALGRTLPASQGSTTANGQTYSIPDIIQTDAPINPGNSGGPLVDDQGMLIGVNAAIESSSQSNSGIGFAIPATIVSRVVPELIKDGKYEHPYLGVSGMTLTPDLAKAMNLDTTQRGTLVEEIVAGSPADKAGIKGSDKAVTLDGQDAAVGGDVITAIDGSPVKAIEDIIAYLANHTSVGQKVTLTLLRDGKEQKMDVTLEARPARTPQGPQQSPQQNQPSTAQGVWLGIAGQTMSAEIAREMKLPDTQTGVLVEQVQSGSPADAAGLRGSDKPVEINGQRVMVGGDIITAVDGKTVTTFDDLKSYIQGANAGQQITLDILRDGKTQSVIATLSQHP